MKNFWLQNKISFDIIASALREIARELARYKLSSNRLNTSGANPAREGKMRSVKKDKVSFLTSRDDGRFFMALKEVPSFGSIKAVVEAQLSKDHYWPADLYPRDGSQELAALENRVGELVGIEGDSLLLYNSGMAAVTDALEIINPSQGTIIMHGFGMYSQTGRYLQGPLRKRGVLTRSEDTGDVDALLRSAEKYKPGIIIAETVGNGPDTPVLEIEVLLEGLRGNPNYHPLIVLDNTLPTSSTLPLAELTRDTDLRLLVVESGTKFYALNRELGGLVYTYNDEIMVLLRERRRMVGSLLNASGVATLNQVLPSKPEFDRRNRLICANTYRLAAACAQAVQVSNKLLISHPNVEPHPNKGYADARFPNGASPVFFIQILDGDISQFQVAERLWDNPRIQEFCRLGQSFGFNETRIWPDQSYPAIRIAGGTEDEDSLRLLEDAFYESLAF